MFYCCLRRSTICGSHNFLGNGRALGPNRATVGVSLELTSRRTHANCFRIAVAVTSGATWRPRRTTGYLEAEKESGWISCGTGTCGSSNAASRSCPSGILRWRPAGNSRLPRAGGGGPQDAHRGAAGLRGPAGLRCCRTGLTPSPALPSLLWAPGSLPLSTSFAPALLLASPLAARTYCLPSGRCGSP